MKRNPDDVGNAFLGYQRSLAWLAEKKVCILFSLIEVSLRILSYFDEIKERFDVKKNQLHYM